MILYRSVLKKGGSTDYSASYTASVNGVLKKASADSAFKGNAEFNLPIIIGNNINSCYQMLSLCSNYNQDIIFPENVNDITYALQRCTAFEANVFIKGNTYREIETNGLFLQSNNSLRKNLYFNSVLNNKFNNTSVPTVVGAGITWNTEISNCFYNADFNVYCYYNYEG